MFDLGDTVPLGVQILDEDDQLVAPGAISLVVTQPDGTSMPGTTPANPATGVYTFAAVPTQAGRHLVRWTTTTPATAHTDTFDVAEAAPPLIIGLAEAKSHLNLDDTNAARDDELRAMLEGVTAVVEGGDGGEFPGVGPVVRRTVTTRSAGGGSEWVLPYSNVLSLTSATYENGGGSISLAGYTFDDAGVVRLSNGGCLPSEAWNLTYVVGRPSLPPNIRMGALEILEDAWDSQRRGGERTPFAVSYRAKALLGSETKALGFA